MSRKDTFHEIVVSTLVREGWTITHDPYLLPFGIYDLQIDLGAEMPIGAEREGRKIAVEIKSFLAFPPLAISTTQSDSSSSTTVC